MSNDQVMAYYLSPGQVEHEFCQALLEMSIYDLMTSRHLAGVFGVRSGALLASARNMVVQQFLEADVADWLLFIDSDMVFERDSLERLFAHADPETCPIIGGLCFGLDYDEGPFPVVYKLVETPDGPMTHRPNKLDQDTGLMPVDGTGTAFLMIHKSVLTAMRDRGFSEAYPWFQETALGRYPVGEDITFCLRARTMGYPIVIDLDLRIGHKKDQIVIGAPPKPELVQMPDEASA
jgi:glycosyltransferase involved in cell wall biosynthesis